MTDDVIDVPPDTSGTATTTDYRGERATYACLKCGSERVIDEQPWRDGPVTIRTGCAECERLRRHAWRCHPAYHVLLDARARRER